MNVMDFGDIQKEIAEMRVMREYGIHPSDIAKKYRTTYRRVRRLTDDVEVRPVVWPGGLPYDDFEQEHLRLSHYPGVLEVRKRFKRLQYLARKIVKSALYLKKLRVGPCEITGDCKGLIHAHHEDYMKPLQVRWLCARHHTQEHARLNRLKKAA